MKILEQCFRVYAAADALEATIAFTKGCRVSPEVAVGAPSAGPWVHRRRVQ